MTSLRFGSSLLAFAICLSFASPDMANTSDMPARSSNESVANANPPPLATGAEDPDPEPALTWSDLTRLAREHRVNGELDEARERLAQAAIQVRALPPTHARRRTVFGAQARLAIELADAGEIESADELANELLAEAEAEPCPLDRRSQAAGAPASRSSRRAHDRASRHDESKSNGPGVQSGRRGLSRK